MKNVTARETRTLSLKSNLRAGITPIPIPGALTVRVALPINLTRTGTLGGSTRFDPGGGI